jgi:hypothetical protein
MSGLLVKCAALIVMIHGFRVLGRIAGPRWSGLALGLPSTTAIVLLLCGHERGSEATTVMAESSLLGLVAAVALPLAYAQAVRSSWRLPESLTAAVAGYVAVAFGLGCLPDIGALPRFATALVAIVAASYWAKRISLPVEAGGGASLTPSQVMTARTAIPAIYIVILGLAERMAGPGWAGLVSTFPSMSLVVLAVTHFEAGPAEASRIAKVLPSGNTSTLAFLAAFRLASPGTGLVGGTIAGYAAALAALSMMEGIIPVRATLWQGTSVAMRIWRSRNVPWRIAPRAELRRDVFGSEAHARGGPRYLIRRSPRHRGRFAPLVETLAW